MADKSISQLSPGVAVTDTDLLPNVQVVGVGPVKTTAVQIKTYVNTNPNVTGVIKAQLGSAAAPSYTFDGDLNTGWWSPAADTLAASTNGTEKIRLTSAGNLGIGVTPSAWSGHKAIEIAVGRGFFSASETAFRMNTGTNAYNNGTNWIYIASTSAGMYSQDGGTHAWFSAPSGTAGNIISFTQAMTLNSSGNLGVGTTSPTSRLQVVSSGTGMASFVGPEYAQIRHSDGTRTLFTSVYNNAAQIGTESSTPLLFVTNNTERARIDTSGNVGIGTTGPTGKLSVSGGTFDITSGDITFLTTARKLGWSVSGQFFNWIESDGVVGNNFMRFAVANAEVMRITNAGNVGIGLSSPSFKLHVQGSGTTALSVVKNTDGFAGGTNFTTPHVLLTSGTDVTGNVTRFAMSVGTGAQIFIDALMESSVTVYSSLLFRTRGADGVAERMRIDSSGNVTIGTTANVNAYKLVALSDIAVHTTNDSAGTTNLRLGTSASLPQGTGVISCTKTAVGAGILTFSTPTSGTVTERMRIDAAGNIGVALAPSAWNSSYRALNIQTASLASAASSSEFYVSANAFLNSASAWVYVASSHATQYRQASGIHSWHNAASGTAGNNITFTQAMTLNASGNLGVGLTNPTFRLQASDANLVAAFGLTNGSYLFRELGGAFANNTLELNIRPNSGKSGYLTFTEDGVADRWSVGIANGSTALRFISGGPAGTERMSIDGNGNVVVNTAAIATNATNGFLYVPSCAGTPTGTPTAYAGRVPIVVDTTNNKLYFYSGGTWRDAGP